tara:strand:- start:1068 stop:1334 length:267 start_codon:yes stop_codon:yes gene_type:complete
MSIKHKNISLTDTLDETSPLIQACNGPQLMLARFRGFSTFYKNKKRNKQVQDDWISANPHRVSRPRANGQALNTEMSKDEYYEQQNKK